MVLSSNTRDTVLQIMREVLKNEELSETDSFFESGGQSISGARLSSRLTQEFKSLVTIIDIFDHQSAVELATLIDSRSPIAAEAS